MCRGRNRPGSSAALGRKQRAETLITRLEARFAKTRAEHPEFASKTAAFAYNFEGKSGSFGAYGAQDLRVRFVTALGFDTDEQIDKLAGDQFFTPISGERLRLLDQDVLVMIGPTPDKRKALEQNPLYRRLGVVRDGRAIYLDMFDEISGAVSFNSPLSLPYAIDELVPRLIAAVDGEPTTKVAESRCPAHRPFETRSRRPARTPWCTARPTGQTRRAPDCEDEHER